MPYVTFHQSPAYRQISFDEIISGVVENAGLISKNETNTRTVFKRELPDKFLENYSIPSMIDELSRFVSKWDRLYSVERESLYSKFYIPKKHGGFREINAPIADLMEALRELKIILECKMFALYHTSAFAYIHGRSTLDAVKRHQANGSNWFLKTDFTDFFGSTTPEFLLRMMSMVFPFSEIVKYENGKELLYKALDLCFLNGGLPQGTPISPLLTNIMMIPIDHRIYNCLRDFHGVNYVYTRYADDSLISSRHKFDMNEIVSFINSTLEEFHAPFVIKDEKTRFGSRSGSNWNLGVMLNKDNEITIGYKNKQRFRAMICNYILDRKNGVTWDIHDVQVLRGHINYYSMVEKDYVENVIRYNNEKYRTNVMRSIKADLGG